MAEFGGLLPESQAGAAATAAAAVVLLNVLGCRLTH